MTEDKLTPNDTVDEDVSESEDLRVEPDVDSDAFDDNAVDDATLDVSQLSEEEKLARIEMLMPIIEGAILATGEALNYKRMQSLFEEHEIPSKGLLVEVLEQIKASCAGRGFDLIEVASGWRFQVREDYAPWVNRLWDERPQKYSRALLETMALIAYRQPLTRGDIEEVRGVAVSSHIIKTLVERDWVKVVGHRDVPGRPALYATTKQFLDYFSLKSLDELPTLGELKDIDSLNEALELDQAFSVEMANSGSNESGDKIEAAEPDDLAQDDTKEHDPLPKESSANAVVAEEFSENQYDIVNDDVKQGQEND